MRLLCRVNLLHLILQLVLLLAIITVTLLARFLTTCIATRLVCIYLCAWLLPIQESITSNLRSSSSRISQDERSSSYHDDRLSLSFQDDDSSSQNCGPSSFQGGSCPSSQDEYFLSSEDKVVEKLGLYKNAIWLNVLLQNLSNATTATTISNTANTLCTPTTTLLVAMFFCVYWFIACMYVEASWPTPESWSNG